MIATLGARGIVLAAVQAGAFDAPPAEPLRRAIESGADVQFDALGFDSLGWMEFCISVELNCGLELTPSVLAGMRSLAEVETWLDARL